VLALKRRDWFVNMIPEMAEWVGIAVTALLTLAALYYGQSLRAG
jgi:hypothetical protein